MTELTLSQLERISDFTTTYLSYYDYDSIFADDKVSMLVKRGTIDKYTDEEKLRNDFMQKLAKYDIEVKGIYYEKRPSRVGNRKYVRIKQPIDRVVFLCYN